MTISFKPVTIIIDDFTTKSSVYQNTSLYDIGYLNTIREYDFYTDVWGNYDGYGDVDLTEYTYYDNTLQYHSTPSASGYEIGMIGGVSNYVDGFGNLAFYQDYQEWVGFQSSANTLQHGDWVYDAFRSQLDNPASMETILIDLDADTSGAVNATQSNNLFGLITSSYSGEVMTTLEGIIEEWLILNNTDTVVYLPIVLSYSIGGNIATPQENYALDFLINNFTTIVQAIPNVNQSGFVWGDTYSDVINVGAYNVDSNGNSLHGNPVNPSVIDILANGYIEHSGWGAGYNFGTSFATPRVSAEIANLWTDYLSIVNQELASGNLTLDDLTNQESGDYSTYVESILDSMSQDIYIELNSGWMEDSISVLSDDVAVSHTPTQVSQVSVGLNEYHVVDSSYVAKLVNYDVSFNIGGNQYLNNLNLNFFNGNTDTNKDLFVKNGGAMVADTIVFDSIRLDDDSSYDFSVDSSDVLYLLKHVAGINELSGGAVFAADVDGDDFVNTIDAVSILKHVGGVSLINDFDLVGADNSLITTIDSNSFAQTQWAIIANGDVDLSGSFSDIHSLQVDIV